MLSRKFQGIAVAALAATAFGAENRLRKGNKLKDDDIVEVLKKSKKGKDKKDECDTEEFSYTADKTYRVGLGESPGITAFEYLGTGYNLFEGNPRGGKSTELDPGFRGSVIQLMQDQSVLTVDGDYTVPLGTELRYVTSCQFDSSSKEMTSVSDYEEELKKEASQSSTFGIGASFAGFSFGASRSFSESEKSRSFAQERLETRSTAFEAKALCTEFEGKLKRYYNHTCTTDFDAALKTLPDFLPHVPLDDNFDPETHCPANPNNGKLGKYRAFVAEYGTHYIIQLLLGAKQVFTTVMNSQDVLRLKENQIEVESALSCKAMFGYSREVEVEATIPIKGVEVSVATTLVTSGSVSGGKEETEYESERRRQVDEIKQKTQTVTEVNIGGTPPPDGDWRTWAATAKDRPMPVSYEMSSLADLMDPDTAESFGKALQCMYGRNVRRILPDFPSGVRFGLSDPNGNPISTYSFDPYSDQRTVTLLRAPSLQGSNDASSPPLFNYDIRWFGSATRVSAVFASPIRDNVPPNTREDLDELGFLDDRFSDDLSIRSNLNSFGVSLEPGRSTLGILDYGSFDSTREERSRSQLNTFSYLTADNLGEDGVVAGVIHPQGYAVNREFGVDPRFSVSMENDHTFYIDLPESQNIDVTFLAFPMWFPTTSSQYPTNSGEIAVGLKSCQSNASGTRCEIQVGAKQSQISLLSLTDSSNPDLVKTDQFLGFSFLAIDETVSRPGLVHGVIEVTPGSGGNPPQVSVASGSGFTALGSWSTPANSFGVAIGTVSGVGDIKANVATTQVTGGVLVTFDTPFSELPAVFASVSGITDRFENQKIDLGILSFIFGGWNIDAEFLCGPSVVVEHVNENQVFIKAGLLDTLSNNLDIRTGSPVEIYKPMSFHFLAAGPIQN